MRKSGRHIQLQKRAIDSVGDLNALHNNSSAATSAPLRELLEMLGIDFGGPGSSGKGVGGVGAAPPT
ncbi:hypothetical protein EON64_12920, partial [archaeon]